MHTLMVADDHPLFREAIAAVIEAGLPGSRLLEAESLDEARRRAAVCDELDLMLLDLGLPDSEGLEGLRALRDTLPWLPVAILSADQERRTILDAINLGAVGYIPKSTPRRDLLAALNQLQDRQYGLANQSRQFGQNVIHDLLRNVLQASPMTRFNIQGADLAAQHDAGGGRVCISQ